MHTTNSDFLRLVGVLLSAILGPIVVVILRLRATWSGSVNPLVRNAMVVVGLCGRKCMLVDGNFKNILKLLLNIKMSRAQV